MSAETVEVAELYCHCTCGLLGCASRRGREARRGITVHGIAGGYTMGCRCDPCTEAHIKKSLAQRKRVNTETRKRATKHGQQWTGAELEVVVRDDLTAQEIAAMLGRTLSAVKNMRHRCRTEPKFINLLGASRDGAA